MAITFISETDAWTGRHGGSLVLNLTNQPGDFIALYPAFAGEGGSGAVSPTYDSGGQWQYRVAVGTDETITLTQTETGRQGIYACAMVFRGVTLGDRPVDDFIPNYTSTEFVYPPSFAIPPFHGPISPSTETHGVVHADPSTDYPSEALYLIIGTGTIEVTSPDHDTASITGQGISGCDGGFSRIRNSIGPDEFPDGSATATVIGYVIGPRTATLGYDATFDYTLNESFSHAVAGFGIIEHPVIAGFVPPPPVETLYGWGTGMGSSL